MGTPLALAALFPVEWDKTGEPVWATLGGTPMVLTNQQTQAPAQETQLVKTGEIALVLLGGTTLVKAGVLTKAKAMELLKPILIHQALPFLRANLGLKAKELHLGNLGEPQAEPAKE